jgi:hypothetical protein
MGIVGVRVVIQFAILAHPYLQHARVVTPPHNIAS